MVYERLRFADIQLGAITLFGVQYDDELGCTALVLCVGKGS